MKSKSSLNKNSSLKKIMNIKHSKNKFYSSKRAQIISRKFYVGKLADLLVKNERIFKNC